MKVKRKKLRKIRIRKKVEGTNTCPRVSVFCSNKNISVQIIDDRNGKTLVAASNVGTKIKGTKTEIAEKVGEELAKKAKEEKIKRVVFDRNGRLYHGRVKSLAESLRKNGLEF